MLIQIVCGACRVTVVVMVVFMVVFVVVAALYLTGFGVMFVSRTFRWTFQEWTLFAVIAAISVALALMAFILGIVCRCNFGKGLLRYRMSFAVGFSAVY